MRQENKKKEVSCVPIIKKIEIYKEIEKKKIIKLGCWGPAPDDYNNQC
jgi:hypothetical protein